MTQPMTDGPVEAILWKDGVDIVICTYNRLAYLKKCVASILPQLRYPATRLTIVDNRSDDGTAEWVQGLMKDHPEIHYLPEHRQGLSYSRTTAAMKTPYGYIFYLDDDSVIPNGCIDEALRLIQLPHEWDLIGGPYFAYEEGKPTEKNPDDPFSFALPYEQVTLLQREYIRGGCMLWNTHVLRTLGGFDPALGMKGNTAGYGEEIEIQQRMRPLGYRIAYAPGLFIYHAVRPEKKVWRWKLHAAYARRRDKRLFDPLPLLHAFGLVVRTILGRMIWTPVHLVKWIYTPAYSWSQCVTDILEPLFFSWGEWIGSLRSRKK